TLYFEDFEHNMGTTPVLLTQYVGAPPVNATYTADPVWLNASQCNGIVLSQGGANQPQCQATSSVGMATLKSLANILGQVAGSTNPSTNHAVSAYTQGGNPCANKVEFATVNPIPLPTSNRYVTFSVDAAAANCGNAHPQLKFFLTGSGADIPVSS